ncbi:putative NADH-flavin reductase [Isoptericola jiangsuensis]|uniref:Putative NADH-flavin reductase n=1 Tax=Isoptericola jiangsuensis TaxID=548579 RepID=A0A2A9EWX0_9MICO|nr:NAD(P)H-binding protein [Isoptericola jiangsuensis]PFG43368.1 putative NADH-flavin reductase [Isoptericola jiangsuensis]
MNIALLGATGRTGRHTLATALDRGHTVTVLTRDPARLPDAVRSRVATVVGEATDPAALARLLDRADAVVSALGPRAKEHDLHTRTARALVEIMQASGPRRFVGVSGAGIDVPGDQKAGKDVAISWLIRTLGGAVVKDKPAEHAVWAASGLDWTLVRPPRLVDGPPTGHLEHDAHRSTRSTTILRSDLGAFLVDVVEQDLYVGVAPFVATARG